MKKITNRAAAVLLIAFAVIFGLLVYVQRYIDDGEKWAMSFSRANSGSSGEITDCNGVRLAFFDGVDSLFSEDELTRRANYHVTGDYWDRTGTGLISSHWHDLQGFSLLTGTTVSEDSVLKLSIDASVNNLAYQAIGEDRKGAVLICNYRTGELIAMVSVPSVDPMDAEGTVGEGAYLNRCLSSAFTPGSVFKLITSAAAIERIPDLFDRTFTCDGVYEIAGVEINCTGVHGEQTFEQALANSCNCAFAKIAVMLGQDTMIEYVTKYGFLDGHSLDGIQTVKGSYPLEFIGDPELAWSGIGQSTDLVCPYSLLRFVCAVANGGELIEPKLIKSDDTPTSRSFMDKETADQLKSLMSFNVAYHYDGDVNFPGLDICAKTGTAELGDGSSHAWFVGFLADEEHPYAFVTLVERGGGGLSVAGSITNTLLQYMCGGQ